MKLSPFWMRLRTRRPAASASLSKRKRCQLESIMKKGLMRLCVWCYGAGANNGLLIITMKRNISEAEKRRGMEDGLELGRALRTFMVPGRFMQGRLISLGFLYSPNPLWLKARANGSFFNHVDRRKCNILFSWGR